MDREEALKDSKGIHVRIFYALGCRRYFILL